jgi:hypothetical protein
VEEGLAGPLGNTFVVNIEDIMLRVQLQQLNRVLLDKWVPAAPFVSPRRFVNCFSPYGLKRDTTIL